MSADSNNVFCAKIQIFNMKIKLARFARSVTKCDFSSYFQTL